MLTKTYPSKILLLGEHTILNGSRALALPYPEYSGRWSFSQEPSERRTHSRESVANFLKHSLEKDIDHAALEADISKGLWFDSSIPQGYGVGSSGALIAGIYEAYGKNKNNLLEDKKSLAHLEDYFHGASSGIDPLVSFLQQPLLIHSFTELEIVTRPISLAGFFLLNTGKPRQAGSLVKLYQEKMKDPQFKQGCADHLTKDVNFAIEALVKDKRTNLAHNLWHISKFQWEFFPEMIPTSIRGVWSVGLESGDYVLKLCGAGGGGFVIGYSEKLRDRELAERLKDFEIKQLA